MWIVKKLWFATKEGSDRQYGYDNWAVTDDKELVDLLRHDTTPLIIGGAETINVFKIDEVRELTLVDMDDGFVTALRMIAAASNAGEGELLPTANAQILIEAGFSVPQTEALLTVFDDG